MEEPEDSWREQAPLPPLPVLVEQVEFDLYGLAAPFRDLQLISLYYGVDEADGNLIGLGLCYAQRHYGSPEVLVVESSLVPASVSAEEPARVLRWSWPNLLSLREIVERHHSPEPMGLPDEETQERKFQEGMEEMRDLYWVPLAPKSVEPPLAGMEVARDRQGMILARRFEGRNMLLVASLGLRPDQFDAAMKLLVLLRRSPEAVRRHQDEFERSAGE